MTKYPVSCFKLMSTIVADPIILRSGRLTLPAETAQESDFTECQATTETFADRIGLATGFHLRNKLA